jgi:hypothetical protein
MLNMLVLPPAPARPGLPACSNPSHPADPTEHAVTVLTSSGTLDLVLKRVDED